jgi:hypothetical protein
LHPCIAVNSQKFPDLKHYKVPVNPLIVNDLQKLVYLCSAWVLLSTMGMLTGKFYVYCAGGRHRTGVMAALYRFNYDHWNYDQVYAEMKQYDFYTSNGHGKQLDFVQDYWQLSQARKRFPPCLQQRVIKLPL